MKYDVWVILNILMYQIYASLVSRKEYKSPNIDERKLFYRPGGYQARGIKKNRWQDLLRTIRY